MTTTNSTDGQIDTDRIWAGIATERRRLADELEGLTESQWTTPSQCAAWTVEEVAAHLIVPFEISTPKFVVAMIRHRGNLDRVILAMTAKVVARTTRAERIAKLRANAENPWRPPRLGPEIPLSEIVVHGQDIRRPLGLECPVPAETIDLALRAIDDDEVRADYAGRIGVVDPISR
ncbi:MAG: maleylpyruvate isomerase family mycothiol-dependent enzyme [Actinomycetota bacterium]